MDYQGKLVWISASDVDASEAVSVSIAAAPLPSPTVESTRTPVPTAKYEAVLPEDWELLKMLVEKDLVGTGYGPDDYTPEQVHSYTGEFAVMMKKAIKKCDSNIPELVEMLDATGQMFWAY